MHLYQLVDNSLIVAENSPEQPRDPMKIRLGVAAIVRRWGTTKGRGELALDGPTANTVIDLEPAGVELNWAHVVRVIPVLEKARKKWLALLITPTS